MHIRDGPLEKLWGEGGAGKIQRKNYCMGTLRGKKNSRTASSPEKKFLHTGIIFLMFLQGKC